MVLRQLYFIVPVVLNINKIFELSMFLVFVCLVFFVALWVWNYYQCKNYNERDGETYADPFRYPVPNPTKQIDCDPRKKLVPCFSDSECLACKDYHLDCNTFDTQTTVIFENEQVLIPKGRFCATNAMQAPLKPINCNIYAGKLVVVQTTTNYQFVCQCKYPWLLTQKTIYDDCNIPVGCKNGTLQLNETDPLNSTCECNENYTAVKDRTFGPKCKPWTVQTFIEQGRVDSNKIVMQKVKFNGEVTDRKIVTLKDEEPLGMYDTDYKIPLKTWGRHSDDPNSTFFYGGDAPIMAVNINFDNGSCYHAFEQPYDEYAEEAAMSMGIKPSIEPTMDGIINRAYDEKAPGMYTKHYLASSILLDAGPEIGNEIKWSSDPPIVEEYAVWDSSALRIGFLGCEQREIPESDESSGVVFLKFLPVNHLLDRGPLQSSHFPTSTTGSPYNSCAILTSSEKHLIPVWQADYTSGEYRYWHQFQAEAYLDPVSEAGIHNLEGLNTWLNSTIMKQDIKDYDQSKPIQ